MFEALVEKLLNKILGEFVQSFSSDNLSIGIWSGQVILKNVVLKKSIIKKLNLPFNIKYSKLGCLKLNIPWKSLTSSKIEVSLEGLEIVIAEIPVSEWECKNTKIIEQRKKQIQSYCEKVVSQFAEKANKAKDKSEDGYFSKLIVKIIDNLQITVKDIHIRYEDDLTKAYSFGITLQELKLYTVNLKGQPQYIDRSKKQYENEPLRKRLELFNFGLYWNEKSQFYSEAECATKMNSTIAKRGQTSCSHNYVILMSSQAKLLQRQPGKQYTEPQINLQIDLSDLKIQITNNQLQQIITLAQRLQKYTRRVKQQNRITLTKEEHIANKEFFKKIFPQYYEGFGKNLIPQDLQKVQSILQKMQTENFTKMINEYLQDKQKQKIIKERTQKNKSWWFGSPKELTKAQLDEIQKYLNDNFGQQVKIVKRPIDYHYIKIGFRLEKLQVSIVNTLAIIKQGIHSQFQDLQIKFSLRDGGYSLQLSLQNIAINTFKQVGIDPRQLKEVLHKLQKKDSKIDSEYLKMIVIGNPLDKKYLNTDIKLKTSQLMVLFDPKIISIATEFADLKLSQQNKQAAIEKYGELKEKTQNVVSESIDKPVKAKIGVDVLISSITVSVPFSPEKQDKDCWGLNLGSINFSTDEETLQRESTDQSFPLDVFKLELTSFSFRHYDNINCLKNYLVGVAQTQSVNSVINDLDFKLKVEIFSTATQQRAKIKLGASIPNLEVNINSFTYYNILKLGDAFQHQNKNINSRVTARIQQKKIIQQKAQKIGFLHIKDSLTKQWKKYVAIMSENYIYLYLNKNDKDYYAYYYIKGVTIDRYKDPLDRQKSYHLKIKNKLNEALFGFDKDEQIEDWVVKIKNLSKEKQFVSQIMKATMVNNLNLPSMIEEAKKKNHNQLNLFVFAEIQSIKANIFLTDNLDKHVVSLSLTRLSTQVYVHESKKKISLQLFSLQLKDSIQTYKNKDLAYFLQTKRKNDEENLINIQVQQLNKDHPSFDHTDSIINVNFGTLICNYKCQTVKALMLFFLPQSQGESQKHQSSIVEAESMISTITLDINEVQNYSLKLNLKIEQISVIMINQKVKTIIGKIGITKLNLYTGISQKRMILKGSLKDLYLIDTTSYPQTICQEQQEYNNERFIMTANLGDGKNMLEFNIEILKVINEYHKNMLIDVRLANLTVYYIQQPVLRLITYLNTQMLPSFQSGSKESTKFVPKDVKPVPATMDLQVVLTNISVFVQTQHQSFDKQKQESLQLNIERIKVTNNSSYKGYVKGEDKKAIILVQNYLVKLQGMSIMVKYYDIKGFLHKYKLTNNLNLDVSTDLIANPDYYKKQLKDTFDNGMRLSVKMTQFFMRMNHDDYNFIMKCLNWSISHNDGVEEELYDIVENQSSQEKGSTPQSKDPFYLNVQMECISLFVTQKNAPIAFLVLDGMTYNLKLIDDRMEMDFIMKRLYGTSISQNQKDKTLKQRGIFNSLGYTSIISIENVVTIEDYISIFYDRRSKMSTIQKGNFLQFSMTTDQKATDIQIKIDELCIDVDIRLLLILSVLANADEGYIKGPNAIRNQIKDRIKQNIQQKNSSNTSKKFSMYFELKKLIGSVSDEKNENFFVIQGDIMLTMLNYGEKTFEELEQIYKRRGFQQSISHSTMLARLSNFSIYFSKIRQEQIVARRDFLRPLSVQFDQKKFYLKEKQLNLLNTDIKAKVSEILMAASLKDMLNVNKIIDYNLKAMNEFQQNQNQEKKSQNKEQQSDEALQQQLKKIEANIGKQIQTKTKLISKIDPIHIEIVNDCGNNFMPVIRLAIEQTEPAMRQTVFTSQIFIVPIISLYFFNPRSSKWEPIIQPFKTTINYNTIGLNEQKRTEIFVKTNSLSQQESSLKLNVSTQMISTLMAAKDIFSVEKNNIDNDIQSKSIEISPFIFHNNTNERIILIRGEDEVQLNPLFKGPLRLINQKQISFKIQNNTFKFSLDHYGTLKIPKCNYLIKFKTQKLNRLIKFIPQMMIKNTLQCPIYIRRYGKVSEVPAKFQPNNFIPLDNIQSFCLSLNGNSYTEKALTKNLKLTNYLQAQKKNFILLLSQKEKNINHTVINILPPFIVHNCLPKSMSLQFIQKAKTKSTVSINSQNSYSVYTSEDIKNIEMKMLIPGYTWSKKFKYGQENQEDQNRLTISDQDDHQTTLNYIFRKDKRTNQYIFTIYCKKIIVNELTDKLIVYGNLQADEKESKGNKYQLLGGQKQGDVAFDDKIIMVGEGVGNMIRVCGVNSLIDFATPISVGGIGSSQSRIVVDREKNGKKQSFFTIVGVQIGAIKMTKQCDIICKKIVLKSKSIIINKTKKDITIKQQNSLYHDFVSQSQSKKNFVFSLPQNQGKIYKYSLHSKGYFPSKLIQLPTQGTTYFKLESQNQIDINGRKQQVYFKIYVKQVLSYSFYEISQITSDEFPYQIVVNSPFLEVTIPSFKKSTKKGQTCRFINQNPQHQQHLLDLQINHVDSKEKIRVRVCPDDLNFKQKHLLKIQKGGLVGSLAILIRVIVNDKQKAIVINQFLAALMQEEKEIPVSTITVNLAQIILSINQNSQAVDVPYESIVVTFRRLLFIQYETDKKKQYQAKIGFLQIDQAYPHYMPNPVILTPDKYQQFTKQKDPSSIFNFTISLSKQFTKNTFINEICLDMSDLVATFTAQFLNLVTMVSNQFGQIINFKDELYLIDKKCEKWQQLEVPPSGSNVFIKDIKIAPFVIDLSAELNLKKLNLQNNILLSTIMSTIGIVMSNIDRAPINMTGIQIKDCIDTVDSISNKLIAHYKKTCISQVYKIVGSLNIIGNPISLFRNISTGVKDLTTKPAQGFVKGPAEFGIGIAQGTSSLVAHSIGGAFNSISKVTGTVSSSLAMLAFDKDFEEHREKQQMKKPQNVIQGLHKGGKAILYGFKQGLTGVFMQPIQNAKKQGALGFFKGTALGLAGLVVKPVTGIIDFASKTTEGIKNNALMFEDKAHEARMRPPRPFYTECFILKNYSILHGALLQIIYKEQNLKRFPNPILIQVFDTLEKGQFLVILQNEIAYLDKQSRKIQWSIKYINIDVELKQDKKMIRFKELKKQSGIFKGQHDVVIQSDENRVLIKQIVLALKAEQLQN